MTKKSGNGSKTFPLGRDSKTGQFTTVKEANRRPATTTVERVPKSGFGDTKGPKNSNPPTNNTGPRKK